MPQRRHGIGEHIAARIAVDDHLRRRQAERPSEQRIEIGDLGRGLIVVRVAAAQLQIELRIEVVGHVAESRGLLVAGLDDGLLKQSQQRTAGERDAVQILIELANLVGEIPAHLPFQRFGRRRGQPQLLRELSQVHVIVQHGGRSSSEQRTREPAVQRRHVGPRVRIEDPVARARQHPERPRVPIDGGVVVLVLEIARLGQEALLTQAAVQRLQRIGVHIDRIDAAIFRFLRGGRQPDGQIIGRCGEQRGAPAFLVPVVDPALS